ncbi:hypothetical protein AC579_441 [Pseudocercospora musae]|uniref:Uncharacterized protein n=1 Tax=Pseudocercospora musae TaxID=113226 RepID=A0A139I6E3_9PEZI|nr:hypothetical protein AC579_441 [Pseudocercospora musae]
MTPQLQRTDSTTAVIDHKQPTLKDKLAAAWNAVKEPFRRRRTHHLLKSLTKAQQSRYFNTVMMALPSKHQRAVHGPRLRSELQSRD